MKKHSHNLFSSHCTTKSRLFTLGNRRFGSLKEDGSFHRTVKLSKHLFRQTDSFGIDLWLVKELERANCQRIIFTEKEEAKRYTISLSDFKRKATKMDLGYGVQLMVERRFWQVKQLPKQLSLEVV